jgi:membrane protein implicated in regulation of membrane protease activity
MAMSEAASPAIIVALILSGIVVFAVVKLLWGMALWFQPNRFRLGQQMQGEEITVTAWSGREGYVDAGGELWRAMSTDALAPGDRVLLSKMKGLTLEVRKV